MLQQAKTDQIRGLLNDPLNQELVQALVAPDATYVSLNFDNTDLKKIMPWTYRQVGEYWKNEGLEVTDSLESDDSVALFGKFTYRSVTVGKAITSPFSILAKFEEGNVVYMQFLEDTFGTASTFRTGGAWTVHSDPQGEEITL